MKLSPTMKDTLVHVATHGGKVVPMRGGWWIIPGTPTKTNRDARGTYEVPDGWSVSAHTIKALVARKLMALATETDTFRDGFIVTPSGYAAVGLS